MFVCICLYLYYLYGLYLVVNVALAGRVVCYIVCCVVLSVLWTTRTCSAPSLFLLNRFHDLIGGIHVPVDDGVDKLNRKYTLLVFLFLALPIFTKQYIGDPIECFTPTYFTEPQARYVNSYCWTASTYYLVAADADDDDYDGFTGQVYVINYCCHKPYHSTIQSFAGRALLRSLPALPLFSVIISFHTLCVDIILSFYSFILEKVT